MELCIESFAVSHSCDRCNIGFPALLQGQMGEGPLDAIDDQSPLSYPLPNLSGRRGN